MLLAERAEFFFLVCIPPFVTFRGILLLVANEVKKNVK